MQPDRSLIPPRYVGTLSDGHLMQAVREYRRIERLLSRNPSPSGLSLLEQLQATLELLQDEAVRRAHGRRENAA